MPMNQFLFDHQLAAMKVDRSGSPQDRKEAADLLGAQAKRMANWRKRNGLSALAGRVTNACLRVKKDNRLAVLKPVSAADHFGRSEWEARAICRKPFPQTAFPPETKRPCHIIDFTSRTDLLSPSRMTV